MQKDLRQFLKLAKESGPEFYVEIKKKLKPEYEKDVIQLKLDKEGRYPIIYCPELEGSKLPLVSNLFGSYQSFAMALGLNPKKASISDILRDYRNKQNKTLPVKNVTTAQAPVKEVILKGKDADLGLLPINKHAELNSTKFIPIGHMICKDPDNGQPNCGVYRHEVKGRNQLGAMLIPYHHAAYHARRYAELGKPMEVAIFIGHHPAVTFGALASGRIDMNELELMGGLMGEPLEVIKAETVDLPVPARAEIVIEGTIDTRKMGTDGPFSEWEGYYGEKRNVYLIDVSCITMRHDAIYHDLAPSQREHDLSTALGFTSTVFDSVKSVVPTVKDVYLPYSGRCNITAYVSIKKRVPGEGKRAALAAINSLAQVKFAVVVDDDIDVFNEEDVLWAIATRSTFDKDISMLPGVLGDPLNPTAYDETRTKDGIMLTKMIIDATRPIELPFPTKVAPSKTLWDSIKLEDYI